MSDLPESQQTLVDDLKDADAPETLIEEAENMHFHDYESPIALPKAALVQRCDSAGLDDIAHEAMRGKYDD